MQKVIKEGLKEPEVAHEGFKLLELGELILGDSEAVVVLSLLGIVEN